jgi:hypothetical protein
MSRWPLVSTHLSTFGTSEAVQPWLMVELRAPSRGISSGPRDLTRRTASQGLALETARTAEPWFTGRYTMAVNPPTWIGRIPGIDGLDDFAGQDHLHAIPSA